MSAPDEQATFDGVAATYDDRFSHQPIARHLRTQVHRLCAPLVSGQARVLEIGCGTGEDARHFAAQGYQVLATDPSDQMLAVTAAKAADLDTPPHTLRWAAGEPAPAGIATMAPFDLVFSNFGALNCVDNLDQLGRDCAALVAPGGHLALVLINRWCLFEMLLGLATLSPRLMRRRWRKHQVTQLEDGQTLTIHFPSPWDLAGHMGPGFRRVALHPIGVFLPPSEYYPSLQKRPRLLRLAVGLDRRLGRLWPFSRLADHYLLILKRR